MSLVAWQVMTAPCRSAVMGRSRLDFDMVPPYWPSTVLLVVDGISTPLWIHMSRDTGLLEADSQVSEPV